MFVKKAILACGCILFSQSVFCDFIKETNLNVKFTNKIEAVDGDLGTSITKLKNKAINRKNPDIDAYNELASFAFKNNCEDAGFAELMLAYVDLRHNGKQKAMDRFDRIVNQQIKSTPDIRLDAALQSARISINAKDYKSAKYKLLSICRQSVPITQDKLFDAATRLGFVFQLMHEEENAIAIWDEIVLKSADQDVVANALLQKSGYLWETGNDMHHKVLTENEKKEYFIKSQQIAKGILDSYPNVKSLTRATANLLYLEQFYFLKKYEVVPPLVDSHIKTYSNHRIQVSTALGWKFMSQFALGEFQNCISTCDFVINEKFSEKEEYDIFPVTAYAYLYKHFCLMAQGKNSIEGDSIEELEFAKKRLNSFNKYNAIYNQVNNEYLKVKKEN